jgi:hypothetical protein
MIQVKQLVPHPGSLVFLEELLSLERKRRVTSLLRPKCCVKAKTDRQSFASVYKL